MLVLLISKHENIVYFSKQGISYRKELNVLDEDQLEIAPNSFKKTTYITDQNFLDVQTNHEDKQKRKCLTRLQNQ